MSMIHSCKKCGQAYWGDSHVCLPRFEVRMEDGDWCEAYGFDAGMAVEEFCRKYDSRQGEYPAERTVEVKDPETHTIRVYEVELRPEPHYTAQATKETKPWEE